MKKHRLFLAILILGLMLCFYPQTAKASMTTLYPTKDSYVDSSNSGINYGLDLSLIVESSSTKDCNIFIYFNLSSVSGKTITGATLQMTMSDASGIPVIQICAAVQTWSETGITWNNQPSWYVTPSVTTASFGSINVLSIVTAWESGLSNDGFAISMVASDSNVTYYSREGAISPMLYIEYESDSGGIPSMGILGIIGILAAVIFLYHMLQRNREPEPSGSLFS